MKNVNINSILNERKRLIEALNFYANINNYTQSDDDRMTGYPPEITHDKGEIARDVLEGLK